MLDIKTLPADCPYTYPHTTIAEQKSYILNHQDYARNREGFWPIAWNIKVYNCDPTGHSGEGSEPITPALDDAWAKHLESHDDLFWMAVEEALRNSQTIDGEYCTYPGDDQGDWKFEVRGRSGGWLVLTHWEPRRGANIPFESGSRDDWENYVNEEMSDTQITLLYQALRCMDQDFAKPAQYINDAYAELRGQWESRIMESPANVSHVGNDTPRPYGFTVEIIPNGTTVNIFAIGTDEDNAQMKAVGNLADALNLSPDDISVIELVF